MKHPVKMTVAEYVRRKENLLYTPFRLYPDGRGVYLTPEGEVAAADFEKANALPFSLVLNQRPNSNTSHDWMN